MAEKVTVKGQIVDARYFPEEKSIVVIVREGNDGKVSKPIQISASSFRFRPDQDVDLEMQRTAELMSQYRGTVNLVFEGQEPAGPTAIRGASKAETAAFGQP